MKHKKHTIPLSIVLILTAVLSFSGCATVPKTSGPAKLTYTTTIHKDLVSLPSPKAKIVVAVYNFRDQSGQYKESLNGSTNFSTAVTQGATTMLVQSLRDSGWFIPVEREGLQNLITERKIIRAALNGDENNSLPRLLYAPILLEGGVVAYETNLVTGGLGVKYFGAGGDTEVRRDQVTIYLRAINTSKGEIIKSVSTTKSIFSKKLQLGFFRFVRVKRLLEVETGITVNEPTQLCVLEAIEKAVLSMIIEGIRDGNWELKNPEEINSPVIQNYLAERHDLNDSGKNLNIESLYENKEAS